MILGIYDATRAEDIDVKRYLDVLRHMGLSIQEVTLGKAVDRIQADLPDLMITFGLGKLVNTELFRYLEKSPDVALIPRIAILSEGENVEPPNPGLDDVLPWGCHEDVFVETVQWRLKRSPQYLRRQQARQYQMLALFAHDLRSLFSGWVTTSEYLQAQFDEIERVDFEAFLELMTASARSGTHVLEQALEYLAPAPQSLKDLPVPIALKPVLLTIQTLLAPKIRLQNLRIQLDIPETFQVYAEQRVLFSVLYNLVDNACNVSPQGGTIRCYLEVLSDQCLIHIQDQGPGFPEHWLQPRHHRVRVSTMTEGKKGWGIGLWLSEKMLKKMGGQLNIQNPQAQGACVTLQLPCSQAK